ncbi:hypothetical protein LOK49_LG04G00857 [Camellia lanceoleosa]|uniref:Uncharacterized protein n=1 Tax=Camellia lanceoleosa TaxID=1840588 RepID=A0ACC0HZ17_9ERIC|nr:hypothetical protein LOK49_LG04G00857 [Camellia lanceoleosa]
MPVHRHSSRVDTIELKFEIERKLGHEKSEKYFHLLNRYLSLKISKSEFDKHCIGTLGRENICLHNRLLRGIIKNACVGKTPPPKESKTGCSLNAKVPNGYQRSNLQSLCRDVFPQSPRKGRTPNLRDRKFKDRPSPLGPHGKIHSIGCEDSVPKIQEQQSATEMLSLGSRPPPEVTSVEEGEEVEQASGISSTYCRSPVTAPLGISVIGKGNQQLPFILTLASIVCLASTRMCILFFGIGDTPCANKGYLRYSTDSRAKQMDNWAETLEKEFYHTSSYTSVEELHSRP